MPAFTAAIEAHQKRITEAILEHALEICRQKTVRALSFSLQIDLFDVKLY